MNRAEVPGFDSLPVLGIVRGVDAAAMERIVGVSVEAGLKSIEVTMNTDNAVAVIRSAVRAAGGKMNVGAGTVVSTELLRLALDAGANFIVMPVVVKDVVERCVKEGLPVFPGALTPQEVYDAWAMGATMVKVFPAGVMGPEYIKELRGPFKDMRLLACGGVRPENMADYFNAGADAVAFGSSVFSRELIARSDFGAIGAAVKKYIDAWKKDCLNKK